MLVNDWSTYRLIVSNYFRTSGTSVDDLSNWGCSPPFESLGNWAFVYIRVVAVAVAVAMGHADVYLLSLQTLVDLAHLFSS